MPRETPTVEELEQFYDQIQGPMGTALRATGVIIERKMRTSGLWVDFSDREVADLFMAAFAEAAPEAYGQFDRAKIEEALAVMASTVTMEMAATADGDDAIN